MRGLVPEGTPISKLQGIILSSKGDQTKLSLMIEDLWTTGIIIVFSLCIADNNSEGWEEVPDKSKVKVCYLRK